MERELIKLADRLDSFNLSGYSNFIDGLIKVCQQEDLNTSFPAEKTVDLNTTTEKQSEWVAKYETESGQVKKIAPNHPLAIAITQVLQKLFALSERQAFTAEEMVRGKTVVEPGQEAPSKGTISMAELNNVFHLALKYDENLVFHPRMEDNPNAISPAQYETIVRGCVQVFYEKYSGRVDEEDLGSTIREFLIMPYLDVYLEEYLGRQPRLEDYQDSQQIMPHFKLDELSPEDKEELFSDQDYLLHKEQDPQYPALSPEKIPPEWRQVLSPPA